VSELRAEHRLRARWRWSVTGRRAIAAAARRPRPRRRAARRTDLVVRAFFLDGRPAVDEIPDLARRDLIVLPLLISAGRHATRDSRRGWCSAGRRQVVVDRPLGLDPAIERS
jgi:sirohydrochlorin ferrochelatase